MTGITSLIIDLLELMRFVSSSNGLNKFNNDSIAVQSFALNDGRLDGTSDENIKMAFFKLNNCSSM